MSHDTGHGHSEEKKNITSFKNSFWLVVIVVGLFIASLNFIQAESGNEEGRKGEAKETTEMNTTTEKSSENVANEAPKAEVPATDTAAKSAK